MQGDISGDQYLTNGDSQANASPRNKYFSERQSSKAVAFRSIQKGIKKNDISLILGQPNKGLTPQKYQDLQIYDEMKEVHDNLGILRKQYDDYRTKSLMTEKEIQRFKDENNKLKIQQDQLINNNQNVNSELDQIKRDFEFSKMRFEEIVMTKKSYNHIYNRLKHDLICFQLKQNMLDQKLQRQFTQKQYSDFKQKQSIQYNAQTQKLLDEMMKNIEMEHRNREEQLSLFKRQIKQRQEAERKRDERFAQQMEIAEHALYDKDANEKKWRKLLLVHKFLHSLLKNKMEKEMKKFSVVEKAFQKIKTATGVNEAQLIVQKFLNREQAYGDLLGKIAESEKKIEYLKRKNENLKTTLQKLKDEVQVMEMTGKQSKKGLEADMYKELQAMDERAKRSEVMQEKLYNWAIKILVRLEKVEKPVGSEKTNFYDVYPHDKSLDAFQHVYRTVLDEIQKAQEEDIDKVLDDLNRSNYHDEMAQEEFVKRNIRVKFKKKVLAPARSFHSQSHESFTKDSNKSMSQAGSSGGGSQYEESDDDNSIDENSELDYMLNLRSELKNTGPKKRKRENTESSKKNNKTSNNAVETRNKSEVTNK